MTTIYLIRHGEIPSSSPRRFVGRADLPLTESGRQQMAELGKSLQACGIDTMFCSPLQRCRESAQILGAYLGCSPQVVRNLAELDLGDWEGLTVEEVQQRFPGSYEARGRDLAGFRPTDGESFADLLERVWPAFTSIAAAGVHRLAVVAHAGVNRVILCRLLGMPLANLFRLGQGYGCLNVVQAERGEFLVESINIRQEPRRCLEPACDNVK